MIGRYTDLQEVDEKHGLRPLLQACIDFLQTNTAELWKQVCITISGEDDKIASGTRKHQFVCRMKNGKPFITEETPVLEHKKPKSSCTSSTETTHKPSKKVSSYTHRVREFRITELTLNINMCLCFKTDNFFKMFFQMDNFELTVTNFCRTLEVLNQNSYKKLSIY